MKKSAAAIVLMFSLSQCNCGFKPVEATSDAGTTPDAGDAPAAGGGSSGIGGGGTGGGTATGDSGTPAGVDGGGAGPMDSGVIRVDAGVACDQLIQVYRQALSEAKKCSPAQPGQPNPCSALVSTGLSCGCNTSADSVRGPAFVLATREVVEAFEKNGCVEACPRCINVETGYCKPAGMPDTYECSDTP
jgi:hypothetical protein